MTSRERVKLTINHKQPDRVPIDIGSTAGNFTNNTFFKIKKHLGITSEDKDILFRPDESSGYYSDVLLEELGGDFRHVFLLPPDNHNYRIEGSDCIISEWGLKKREVNGLMQIINSPLSNAQVDDIDKYNWPDPSDKGRVRGLRKRAKFLYQNTEYAVASRAVSHGFFELAMELRGMENFLMDMCINKKFANKLLEKTLEIQIKLYEVLLKEAGQYIHIVETADDYGTQSGPIMSPKLFREMIKSRRVELNKFIKEMAPGVKIFHHTCGSVYKLIGDLIDTGIDILNPVQPLARDMDSYRLKKEFGDRLCFHGGIDEQRAIPGPKDILEQEIRERIEAFSPGGGYIIAPTSNFQDDTPIENILFFMKAAKKYGRY